MDRVTEQFGDIRKWRGQCHYAATMLVQFGIVQGHVRYGNWMGPIHPDCPEFGGRTFTHHGWIELEDGSIVDPTRWVFEHVEPYVYEGPNDHYDAGGNVVREAIQGRTPPTFNPSKQTYLLSVPLELLDFFYEQCDDDGMVVLDIDQLFWVANLSPRVLGGNAGAAILYRELDRLEMGMLVPIDNWRMVMGS